jgi:hypothetical protein
MNCYAYSKRILVELNRSVLLINSSLDGEHTVPVCDIIY